MKYLSVPVTPFAQNCSIVWCETGRDCAFIDPGGDTEKLMAVVAREGLKPVAVWLTHGHLDHVGGTQVLARHYGIPVLGPHEEDAFWLDALPLQSRQFGFPAHEAFRPDHWLADGDSLQVGGESFEVILTPGHTPGHVVLFNREAGVVFGGDVLFAGSIGRTDFPRGNHQQLLDSIRNRLWVLGDDVVVVPGHGPNTTIGRERRTNPFLR
ncbi:MAG: MBL fold metallo-hydrolase [Thiothrix sp.]|nr:MBL fold metallo-hydrolase [Thiothrix sp.]HPQ95031.1 MBL fold metallo-hydrolase [Thiolinea sp.]